MYIIIKVKGVVLMRIIKETLNEDISVGEIAKRLDVSVYYMCHAFKKATGVTIVDYRNELKIVNAKKLLINTDKKITEIASECGFDSDSYFGKIFKQYENLSPAQYRSSVRNIKG